MDFTIEQENLTKALVKINSVVGTDSSSICKFIKTWLEDETNIPKGLLDIFHVPCEGGESLIALLKAPKETDETVILLGHIDTVEIDDFGALKDLALDPDALEKAYLSLIHDGQIQDEQFAKDLKSGEYMLGRGSLDMKSGVASNMQTLKYFANHRDEQKFNLLLVCEWDEEGDSKGMLSSMDFVKGLFEENGLKASYGLCSDFSTQPAIYLGTIGKFLPCFVAFGKEAHVGDALNSVDPNLIISNVICNIDYNPAYADQNLGERTQPPVSLKQTDTKESYSVQTPGASYCYFNWFALKKSPAEVLKLCLEEGRIAMANALGKLPVSYKQRVYSLDEYAKLLGEQLIPPGPKDDPRKAWLLEAERLRKLDTDKDPVLLVFLSGLSYPAITVSPDGTLGKAAKSLGLPVRIYYPYISDVSFLGLLGDVPVVNLGTYGYDGHTPRERVNKKYTFDTLPKLQISLIKELGK